MWDLVLFKLSDFLLDLRRSLAHKGFAKKSLNLGIIIFDIEKISVDEVFAVLQPAIKETDI